MLSFVFVCILEFSFSPIYVAVRIHGFFCYLRVWLIAIYLFDAGRIPDLSGESPLSCLPWPLGTSSWFLEHILILWCEMFQAHLVLFPACPVSVSAYGSGAVARNDLDPARPGPYSSRGHIDISLLQPALWPDQPLWLLWLQVVSQQQPLGNFRKEKVYYSWVLQGCVTCLRRAWGCRARWVQEEWGWEHVCARTHLDLGFCLYRGRGWGAWGFESSLFIGEFKT